MHTILLAPVFEDRRPTPDSLIWRVTLPEIQAFRLLCDIGHLYVSSAQRPRVGAMLEADGRFTIYLWPKATPDSRLLLTMLDYGAARLADSSRWAGQAWITGDLLYKVLATLAQRRYAAQLAKVQP
jgi:hypothetical protein